jgi:hypothetical protein
VRTGPDGELLVVEDDEAWPVLILEHRHGSAHGAVLMARIGDERIAAPVRLLLLAGQMGAGALALVGGAYVVRFVVPAAQVGTAALRPIVRYVREVAQALASELTTAAPGEAAFAHLGG